MEKENKSNFQFQEIRKYGDDVLVAARDSYGLTFYIRANNQRVFILPYLMKDSKTNESYVGGLALSEQILNFSEDGLIKVKDIFEDCRPLILTFMNIVIDNEQNAPYRKNEIKELLGLSLTPDEKSKLQLIYDDFTYIYLIRDADTGLTKIGRSGDPQSRIQKLIKQDTLQPTPNNYYFIGYWLDRISLEQKLHQRCSNQRMRGEWFDLSEEDIAEIRYVHIEYSEDFYFKGAEL